MKIIVINGAPGSGKDSFVKAAQELETPKCYLTSTVDEVKNIAYDIGWNGEKSPKSRKFLSDLKDLLTEFNDYPLQTCVDYINHILLYLDGADISTKNIIFFIMCREPKEIDRIKYLFNAKTLVVRRPDVEHIRYLTSSDNDVLNYEYDYEIFNDTTLEKFMESAQELTKYIASEDWNSNTLEFKIWDRHKY